ncbi:hypothetical protein C1645_700528 [Glomus cerebriforme]|uniref:HCP-like protein n=1 Tax=Glomus cerebriforme TaxID=658196 RepID=A0A397SAG3_9GLOM|nr:hypothetical protein C1645_700528 [Glomus cerebriforme]
MTSSSQNIFCYSSLIGYFYQHGIGCEVNEAKAFEIFSNAIKYIQKTESNKFSFDQNNKTTTDDIEKLNEIVLQYFYSLFIYKNIILNKYGIYKLHIRNAEKGDPTSQYYIGSCYYYGIKIKCDHNKAIEWYLKSSEGGNIKSMYMLGHCYSVGSGVIKDVKKAFEFYLKSAEGGHKYASSRLGYFYCFGIGIVKDKSKAFEFYLRAAEKGCASSQFDVANFYYDGIYVPKDEEKGFYWCRKAAIYGSLYAQHKLAEHYLNNPINKNENKAFKWYLKLANKNDSVAIYLIAKCYRDGIGTDKSLVEAEKWIQKYITSYGSEKPQLKLNDFLNGSDY